MKCHSPMPIIDHTRMLTTWRLPAMRARNHGENRVRKMGIVMHRRDGELLRGAQGRGGRANVLAKLGMSNRVQLTRYAIRRGLVEP